DLSTVDAAAANLLGRAYRDYDEAGTVTMPAYDLDGNPLTKTRQTLRVDLLLAALPAAGGAWDGTAYAVDWQPDAGQTLDQHANRLLDEAQYRIDSSYDALRRVTAVTYPADVTGVRSTIGHAYTPTAQLTSVTLDGAPQLRQAVYNARGQRTLAVLGGG